jgi:hypothetical protein
MYGQKKLSAEIYSKRNELSSVADDPADVEDEDLRDSYEALWKYCEELNELAEKAELKLESIEGVFKDLAEDFAATIDQA